MIDESYSVTVYRFRCEYCSRVFEGQSAREEAESCEDECYEASTRNLVRVFLPPPGRHHSMYNWQYWRFVTVGSYEAHCAARGHDEERFWVPAPTITREVPTFDSAGNAAGFIVRIQEREREKVRCRRCEAEVFDHGYRVRDKPPETL